MGIASPIGGLATLALSASAGVTEKCWFGGSRINVKFDASNGTKKGQPERLSLFQINRKCHPELKP
jgi:hypothetical protein